MCVVFFSFLKVKVRGTKVITGLPLFTNSRVQDSNTFSTSVKRMFASQRKGSSGNTSPCSLSLSLPLAFPGAAASPLWHRSQTSRRTFSTAPAPTPNLPGCSYPGHLLPWQEVIAALGHRLGESRCDKRGSLRPYLCCHKLHQHLEGDAGWTVESVKDFIAAACPASL